MDPDAILYADRLRGHLQWHVGQPLVERATGATRGSHPRDVFFLNCAKYIPATMYGALEVFSKAALGAYLSQHARCEHELPFWSWGEDRPQNMLREVLPARYMAGCLEKLGAPGLWKASMDQLRCKPSLIT